MDKRTGIVWFRQDLRMHDNEALTEAIKNCQSVLPIYIFDEHTFFGNTKFGFRKTDRIRAKFIIECVHDLRASLKKLGSNLIVRVGKPEEEIFKLARTCRTTWVFCNRERTREEMEVQDCLEKKLWTIGQEIRFSRGKMLYYTADLPFPINHTPDIFSHFRKEVERFVEIRKPFSAPKKLSTVISSEISEGKIPTLEDLGFEKEERAEPEFKGGETEGLNRLYQYFFESENPKYFKESRNQLIKSNLSAKLSPWLAQGCLSPKVVYWELKNFEIKKGKNKSTLELFHALMYRDFLRFMGKKHGDNIFKRGGILQKRNPELKNDLTIFQIWKDGRTGIPLVDANMRKLNKTGFIPNRGRRNVADFLVNNLKINWQIGAEYFESKLIDYDPCSNYVNWNLIAGVADDHKEERHLNILAQSKKLDPSGDYIRKWLPELKSLPQDKIHCPSEFSELNSKIGSGYPKPMINLEKLV